ncbi:MAG TPA: GNAT family N-acetyltransferase [Longimicrobium sp.]|nr:GNAT family N-acetyltransferase [Longimicrobium sp.]
MPATADGLVIRDARDADREAVRKVTLAAYAEYARVMEPAAWAGLDGAVRAALESGGAIDRIVAEHAGRVVGSVMLFPPQVQAYGELAGAARAPELRLLAVSPDARGLGVGRALVDECIRRAREMGATELGLHTSRSMQVAMGMYRRMGFVRAPEADFHPAGAERVEGYRLPLEDSRPGSVGSPEG